MADSEKQLIKNMPNQVKKIADIPKVQRHFQRKVKKADGQLFSGIRKWQANKQLAKIRGKKGTPIHKGTKGENKVIEELKKLNDNYHVLCGVRIAIPHYVTYNNQSRLRSAQMDFVLVCPRGVFMIEVKNWSNSFVQTHHKSPHKQTGRAGLLLWVKLQNMFKNIPVTNVLLSIQGNIKYDSNHRSVHVTSLDSMIPFLKKREISLNRRQVREMIEFLKPYVTKHR
jgi:hypothetical protein